MFLGSFRHMMVYVGDLPTSRAFYEQFLGFMGYSLAHGTDDYCMWSPSEGGCDFGIVQTESGFKDTVYKRGVPGYHHLAFNADSRAHIDTLYELLKKIGAIVLDPPDECPEYSPTYYAVYFEDPDGLKLEVAHS